VAANATKHDVPRQKLQEIVAHYGDAIVEDPRRCRALLLDLCGEYRREIFVLTTAQEEQVPNDLLEMGERMPTSVLVAQLTRRLMDNRALTEDAARWAVESWAEALGLEIAGASPIRRRSPDRGAEARVSVNVKRDFPQPEGYQSETSPNRGTVFASRHKIKVLGRPRTDPDATWQKLGTTPGDVAVPSDYVLGLRLLDLESEASGKPKGAVSRKLDWIAALDRPSTIVWLDTDRLAVTEADLIALEPLTNLMRLDIKNGGQITDTGLRTLRELRPLNYLSLFRSKVTDAGLAHLAGCRHLTQLDLRGSKRLTGEGFASLVSLTNLGSLECAECSQIIDEGLANLSTLRTLHRLNLSRCSQITHRGLAHLRALTALTYLDISGNMRIDDQGVAQLRSLSELANLNLSHTRITNEALAHVQHLSNLVYLDLSGCEQITNRGLRYIRQLPYLAYLNLMGCPRINARGIARLDQPGLFVLHPET
jgi:ABC-type transporter Mla MlaB component